VNADLLTSDREGMDDLQPLCPASAIPTEGGSKMETCDHCGKALPAILTRDILGIARWQVFALRSL